MKSKRYLWLGQCALPRPNLFWPITVGDNDEAAVVHKLWMTINGAIKIGSRAANKENIYHFTSHTPFLSFPQALQTTFPFRGTRGLWAMRPAKKKRGSSRHLRRQEKSGKHDGEHRSAAMGSRIGRAAGDVQRHSGHHRRQLKVALLAYISTQIS